MLGEAFNVIIHTFIFLCLFIIDYILGNGFIDMFQKIFCKITCFVKKTIREEEKFIQITGNGNSISLPVLFTEILLLSVTLAVSHTNKWSPPNNIKVLRINITTIFTHSDACYSFVLFISLFDRWYVAGPYVSKVSTAKSRTMSPVTNRHVILFSPPDAFCCYCRSTRWSGGEWYLRSCQRIFIIYI